MITKEELLEYLKPYIEAGIITDTVFVSDTFCVFVLGGIRYAAFPCILSDENYPIGIALTAEQIKKSIKIPNWFVTFFKGLVKRSLNTMLHFNKENLPIYAKNIENLKKSGSPSMVDDAFTDEIKSRYMGKTKYKREKYGRIFTDWNSWNDARRDFWR